MKRFSKNFRRSRRGSYLALTMIIALALTAIGASFISVTTTASRTTEADFTEQNLVYVAETGIDQAISTLNRYLAKSSTDHENWTTPQPPDSIKEWTGASSAIFGSGGWTATGDNYRKDFGIFTLGNGRKARLRVVVRQVPNPEKMTLVPEIIAEVAYDPEARHTHLGSLPYSRQFSVLMRRSTRYPNSLLGTDGVTFGDSFTVDSYNSNNGTYAVGTNQGDKALVATISQNDGAIKGSSPVIYGYIATGGDNPTDNLGGDARLYGAGSLPPYKATTGSSKGVDPGRIVRDFSGEFPVATAPATTGLLNTNLLRTLPLVNGLVVLPAGSYRLTNPLQLPQTITWLEDNPLGALLGKITKELTITGIATLGDVTIVVDGVPGADPATVPAIGLKGNSRLLLPLNSTLKVYTPGNVDISNGGIINGAVNTATGVVSSVVDILAPNTNTTLKPQNFRVFGTNTNTADGQRQTIGIAGNGKFSGVIDAPNADIILRSGSTSTLSLADLAAITSGSGGLDLSATLAGLGVNISLGSPSGFGFHGAVIGRHVTSVGQFAFHYDEALGTLMFPTYTMDTWVERRGANKVDMSAFGF
jgi:hypothetical protein